MTLPSSEMPGGSSPEFTGQDVLTDILEMSVCMYASNLHSAACHTVAPKLLQGNNILPHKLSNTMFPLPLASQPDPTSLESHQGGTLADGNPNWHSFKLAMREKLAWI